MIGVIPLPADEENPWAGIGSTKVPDPPRREARTGCICPANG